MGIVMDGVAWTGFADPGTAAFTQVPCMVPTIVRGRRV